MLPQPNTIGRRRRDRRDPEGGNERRVNYGKRAYFNFLLSRHRTKKLNNEMCTGENCAHLVRNQLSELEANI